VKTVALGASHWRVWRQLFIESLLLAAFGGLLGAGLAWALLHLALPWIPEDMPRIDEVGLNHRVLCFTAGISLFCEILSSLWPAFKLTHVDPIDALREQVRSVTYGRSSRRMQNILVVVQTRLGATLLIASGFLIRRFLNVRNTDAGFSPVISMDVPILPTVN